MAKPNSTAKHRADVPANVVLATRDVTRATLTEFLANTAGEVRLESWSHGEFLVGEALPPVEEN